jgi:hypothetical protein
MSVIIAQISELRISRDSAWPESYLSGHMPAGNMPSQSGFPQASILKKQRAEVVRSPPIHSRCSTKDEEFILPDLLKQMGSMTQKLTFNS